MAGSKSGPTLFELMGGSKTNGREAARVAAQPATPITVKPPPQRPPTAPQRTPAPTPAPAASPPAGAEARAPARVPAAPPPEPIAEPAGDEGERPRLRSVVLTPTSLFIGLAVLALIAVALWAAAWERGHKAGEETTRSDLMPSIGAETPAVREPTESTPGRGSGTGNQAAGNQPTGNQPQRQPDRAGGDQAGSRPSQPTQPHAGRVIDSERDPRTADLNYLVIAGQLSRDEAGRMAEFLTARGLPAYAISDRFDPPSGAAKNRGLFYVYSAEGIEGRGFATNPRREVITRRAQELGPLWRQQGGQTDFRQTFWDKYTPGQ